MTRADLGLPRGTRLGLAIIGGAALALAGSAMAAAADDTTTVAFADGSRAVTVGDLWTIRLQVDTDTTRVLDAQDGAVDIFLDGSTTPLVGDLPLLRDGTVLISAPADTVIPAGDHQVTAIFRPAAGSGLTSSQSGTPLALSVAPFASAGGVEIVAGEDGALIARLTLEDPPRTGQLGSWQVTVTAGAETVQEIDVELPPDNSSVEVPLDLDTIDGREVDVAAVFQPAAGLEDSVDISEPAPATVPGSGDGLIGFLAAPLTLPAPVWIAAAAALIALLAASAAAIIRRRRSTGALASIDQSDGGAP